MAPAGDSFLFFFLHHISKLYHIGYTEMDWSVEILGSAEAEMDALPPGLQARLTRLMEMVECIGLEAMREPHVKHIDGKLWETSRQGTGRNSTRVIRGCNRQANCDFACLCKKITTDTPKMRWHWPIGG